MNASIQSAKLIYMYMTLNGSKPLNNAKPSSLTWPWWFSINIALIAALPLSVSSLSANRLGSSLTTPPIPYKFLLICKNSYFNSKREAWVAILVSLVNFSSSRWCFTWLSTMQSFALIAKNTRWNIKDSETCIMRLSKRSRTTIPALCGSIWEVFRPTNSSYSSQCGFYLSINLIS